MNTTTINSTTSHLPIERLGHYDPAVEQRVQQWLASGQLLAWIPILSQENFPDTPPEVLQFADQYQAAMRWPIHRPEDLLTLPDGITGWLLPAGCCRLTPTIRTWPAASGTARSTSWACRISAPVGGRPCWANMLMFRQMLAIRARFDLASAREEAFIQTPYDMEFEMTRSTSLAAQLASLPTMPMKDLWALWDAHFPRRPGTWNRDYVASRVAYKIQEAAHGGVDPDIRRRLVRLGESQSAFGKRRSEVHLMPGTVLLREYESNEYRVTVTPEGFYDLNGKVFKSLSAVARHITGVNWSGPAFFGVKQKGGKK